MYKRLKAIFFSEMAKKEKADQAQTAANQEPSVVKGLFQQMGLMKKDPVPAPVSGLAEKKELEEEKKIEQASDVEDEDEDVDEDDYDDEEEEKENEEIELKKKREISQVKGLHELMRIEKKKYDKAVAEEKASKSQVINDDTKAGPSSANEIIKKEKQQSDDEDVASAYKKHIEKNEQNEESEGEETELQKSILKKKPDVTKIEGKKPKVKPEKNNIQEQEYNETDDESEELKSNFLGQPQRDIEEFRVNKKFLTRNCIAILI